MTERFGNSDGPRGRDTGTFSAVFDELELVDVLQLLHQARRSATVVVEGHGFICFERGEMRHAEAGDRIGEPALEALLAVQGGDVKVKDPQPGPTSLDRPFQAMMLDTMTRMDEASHAQVPAPRRPTDPFAALADQAGSAGTGAFEWGPASPAEADPEDRSVEAFDAMLDYEFVDEGPGSVEITPSAPVVIAPPRVAAPVASATPAPRPSRPAPSWKRMTDARRPTPPRGQRRPTGPTRSTYQLSQLPEPAVEINRARPTAAPRKSNLGFVLLVGVLCMMLGLGIAAWLWGPAAEPAVDGDAPAASDAVPAASTPASDAESLAAP